MSAGEFASKLAQVRAVLEDWKLGGALIESPGYFGWLTGGGENHGVRGLRPAIFVRRDRAHLIAAPAEMARLLAEDLSGLDLEPFPFEGPPSAAIPALPDVDVSKGGPGFSWCSDPGIDAFTSAAREIGVLAATLTPDDVSRYRLLGEDLAVAVTHACFHARPGLSERQVAGMLAGVLHGFGIEPVDLLVGADERVDRWPSPLPTAARLRERLLIAVCGRRGGLHASIARLLAFTPPEESIARRYAALQRAYAVLIARTHPTGSVSEALAAARGGCGILSVANHVETLCPGGPTGYHATWLGLETRYDDCFHPNQAFTWRLTAPGIRLEDTLLAGAPGPEVLTRTPDLPVEILEVEGLSLPVPAILVR